MQLNKVYKNQILFIYWDVPYSATWAQALVAALTASGSSMSTVGKELYLCKMQFFFLQADVENKIRQVIASDF